MTAAVEIKNLSHSYTGPPVLSRVNFSVDAGEIFGLLGPNGGGKTTLFQILSTLLKPTAGEAEIFGASAIKNPDRARGQIGVVFQSPSLDKVLTVKENLLCHGQLTGLSGAALRERIDAVLSQFSISDRAHHVVDTLSGGLKRRVEIAKGVVHTPKLLIMDEPSTGLDPTARRELWNVLTTLRSNGITIILTTHLMDEADRCDRLAIINKGHLVAVGSPSELKNKIGGDVVSIASPNAAALSRQIQERFGDDARVVEDIVRIERSNGAEFIPQLSAAFSAEIDSISVGKPTLEDVFIHMTGEDFRAEP